MFFCWPKSTGRYVLCVLLAMVFCVIIWASPGELSYQSVFSEKVQTPTLIIDPGHGGEDGGAVSSGGLVESGVNLDIALRLRELALFLGIESVMTRETDDIEYPRSAGTVAARKRWDTKRRVEIISDVEGGVLVSIHQNCYPTAAPWGSQVFYAESDGSRHLAELVHENLICAICPENRRVAAPIGEDIYIMSHVECPAVLVECGFLSNAQEAERLSDPSYRLKLAVVLAGSFLQYGEALDETKDSILLHTMR